MEKVKLTLSIDEQLIDLAKPVFEADKLHGIAKSDLSHLLMFSKNLD